ncbi:meteorin isoform X1 [Accipiter gentilis]|uniref:meteorin isoform X1 n=1 Tax=Astur gentilis TaxID=8957 RepID=UPI002110D87A|nr:meteorin isoform X1 [Accipiter gentilis]
MWALRALCLAGLGAALGGASADQCSWRGSGLSQEAGSVEQLSLHCAEGSLEWLYPTGALRLRLAPRLPPPTAAVKGRSPQHVTACVKPAGTFRGAQLYLEREGVLELLLPEAPRPRVRCFSWLPREKVALFLQATPHRDISRRIAAFRYELRGDWLARPALPAASFTGEGACRPCNDTEILMAICTSDFVIRGSIRSVSNDVELQESVIGEPWGGCRGRGARPKGARGMARREEGWRRDQRCAWHSRGRTKAPMQEGAGGAGRGRAVPPITASLGPWPRGGCQVPLCWVASGRARRASRGEFLTVGVGGIVCALKL